MDYRGDVYTYYIDDLKTLEKFGGIANGKIIGDQVTIEDNYEIHKDEEFKQLIESKYNNFMAKTIMLGYRNIDFAYKIENHEVILTDYTGSNTNIILPSFITAIERNAFKSRGIRTINLNAGLKVIGQNAFAFNKLEQVEIPETVELVGWGAVYENARIIKYGSELNTNRFKLRSQKTVVLNQNDRISEE